MEIKQLVYFIETCKTMNISAAADLLFVTPQALSKAIIKLENDIGAKVFHRHRKALKLTEFGEILHAEALPIVVGFGEFESKIKALLRQDGGKIIIGRVGSTEDFLVDDAIGAFLDAYPDIQIEIKEMPRELIEESLLLQKIDVGICVKLPHHASLFDSVNIESDEICCVMRKDNSLYQKKELYISDLEGQTLTKHTDMETIEEFIEGKCASHGFKLGWQLKSSYIAVNRSYMHRKNAIIFYPQRNCKTYKFTDLVGFRPFAKSEGLIWSSHIISAKDRLASKTVRLFLAFLKQSISQEN